MNNVEIYHIPPLSQHEGSWVIVCRATGEAVCEIFEHSIVEKINFAKYKPVPAGEYLGELNTKIKDQA